MSKRKPRSRYDLQQPNDPDLALLLRRARMGEGLTDSETSRLLSVNPHYTFRFTPPGPIEPGADASQLLRSAPYWRMLGRSMPILHKNESFTLVMCSVWAAPATDRYYWGVHLEGEPISEGYESTPQHAALRGANEFEWEQWVRLPTEPPDYDRATPSTPLCDVCGVFASSMCKFCEHKFCETTGNCPHQPRFVRSSCLFCRKEGHAFTPPLVEPNH